MPVIAADVQRAVAGFGPVSLKLGKIGVFHGADSGKDFDVVYVEVTSTDLKKLHAKLSQLPHKKTHPGPPVFHATLAYVRKGYGARVAAMFRPLDLDATADAVVFSDKDGNKTTIPTTDPVAYTRTAYADGSTGRK